MTLGNSLFDQVVLVLVFDVFLDSGRIHQDFGSRHSPVTILGRQQAERNNARQHFGKQQADFVVLVRRIHRKHTVNRFRRVRGMDRRKHHVARIGSGQGNLHRFQVTNFAHQKHIRVLTERRTQGVRIRKRIHANFTLRNNGLVIAVKVFNRVFDRNDIHRFVLIDVIEHGGQCRRLTRTSSTCNQHETALGQRHVANHIGQMQVFESRNLRLDMTNHDCNRSTLAEHVHTETTHVAGTHGKVTFLVRFKALFLVAVHDIIQEGIHHHGIDSDIKRTLQRTVDTIDRRNPYAQMQVRRIAVHHFTKQLFNTKLRLLISH